MSSHPAPAAVPFSAVPSATGLYDPANDRDACGVAFVADVRGRRSRRIVSAGLTALHNLDHRGAAGSEPNSGDGAGILTQIPDALLRASVDFELPPLGEYSVGIAFLPTDENERSARMDAVTKIADEEGLTVLGWRQGPVDPDGADVGRTPSPRPRARSCRISRSCSSPRRWAPAPTRRRSAAASSATA